MLAYDSDLATVNAMFAAAYGPSNPSPREFEFTPSGGAIDLSPEEIEFISTTPDLTLDLTLDLTPEEIEFISTSRPNDPLSELALQTLVYEGDMPVGFRVDGADLAFPANRWDCGSVVDGSGSAAPDDSSTCLIACIRAGHYAYTGELYDFDALRTLSASAPQTSMLIEEALVLLDLLDLRVEYHEIDQHMRILNPDGSNSIGIWLQAGHFTLSVPDTNTWRLRALADIDRRNYPRTV